MMKVIINPEKYPYQVGMDEVCVSKTNKTLKTGGMSYCSALVVIGQGKQLLSHVGSEDSVEKNEIQSTVLADTMSDNFDLNDSDLKIYVVPGDNGHDHEDFADDDGSTEVTLGIIHAAITELGLEDKATQLDGYYTYFYDDLVVSNGGIKIEESQSMPRPPSVPPPGQNFRP